MFESLIGKSVIREGQQCGHWHPEGRPVRLGVLSWPGIFLLGAIVPTAACLLGDWGLDVHSHARQTLVGQARAIKSIAFRPDSFMISSVGFDGSIVIWDLANRPEYPFLLRGTEKVRCAAFSPDNRLLALASSTAPVAIHDLGVQESRCLEDAAGATRCAAALAFAPGAATLAVGQEDGKITVWNAATGRLRVTLAGHTEFVAALAVAPDGRSLASSGADRLVRIWDLPSGRQRQAINSPSGTCVALMFSSDGGLLVLGNRASPVLRLWDMAAGTERGTLRASSGNVVAAAINPGGTILAAADFDGLITFWDLSTLTTRPARLSHPGVCSLAFAPNGRSLATAGFDGTIRLWEPPLPFGN